MHIQVPACWTANVSYFAGNAEVVNTSYQCQQDGSLRVCMDAEAPKQSTDRFIVRLSDCLRDTRSQFSVQLTVS